MPVMRIHLRQQQETVAWLIQLFTFSVVYVIEICLLFDMLPREEFINCSSSLTTINKMGPSSKKVELCLL